jgi:hypothetical protein
LQIGVPFKQTVHSQPVLWQQHRQRHMHWTISKQSMSSHVQQMHTPFDNISQVHSQLSKQHSQQAASSRVQQTLHRQHSNSRQTF